MKALATWLYRTPRLDYGLRGLGLNAKSSSCASIALKIEHHQTWSECCLTKFDHLPKSCQLCVSPSSSNSVLFPIPKLFRGHEIQLWKNKEIGTYVLPPYCIPNKLAMSGSSFNPTGGGRARVWNQIRSICHLSPAKVFGPLSPRSKISIWFKKLALRKEQKNKVAVTRWS